MKWKCKFQRTAAVVLCLLLCLCNMRTAASASEAYPYPTITDLDSLCSLTLYYSMEENGVQVPVPGVTVRIYRVADVSSDVRFTLAGDFAGYSVSLDDMDNDKWAALAYTLRGYAFLDNVQPLRVGVSGEDGFATFADLPIGLYLVDGERTGSAEEGYRQPAPFMVCLPNWEKTSDPGTGTESAGWQYDVSARPKYVFLDGGITMRRVLKVWNDDGNAANRPAQITVTLLKDGAVYDTVDLNAENNWRYSWDELDGNADWQMVENVNGGSYTVSVSLQGLTFVVTNTYSPPPPPPPPPENPPDNPPPENPPDNPPPENPPDTPENPPSVPPPPDEEIDEPPVPTSSREDPDPDPEPSEEDLDEPPVPLAKLPQTGQLWWPVPLLAMGGMVMILLGIVFRRRSPDDEA